MVFQLDVYEYERSIWTFLLGASFVNNLVRNIGQNADTMKINEMSFVSNVTSSHSTQRNLLKANANPLSENELMRGCLTFAKRTKKHSCGELY